MRNSSIKEAINVLGNAEADSRNASFTPLFVAGRIVGILDDGFVLQDESGRIDLVYGAEVNVGDIVEAAVAFKRNVGADGMAVTVFCADSVTVLVKCTEDFFIRKSDPNYRKIIIDTALREKFVQRQKLTQKIRDFFTAKNFVEAETPLMVRLPGMEPHLDAFKTELAGAPGGESQKEDMYLITSPEYSLKKLLVGGFERIFQLSHCFRNRETESELHNPEFTMLEWYRAYADYKDIMKDTEDLVFELARAVGGASVAGSAAVTAAGEKDSDGGGGAAVEIVFKDYRIDLSPPFPRMSVKDLFEKYADIDEETLLDGEKLREAAKKRGHKIAADAPYEDSFYIIFMNEVEPRLGITKPVIVFDYPAQMAAMARKSVADPRYVERFEIYTGGVELCNGYSELNDPVEQEERLLREQAQRQKTGKDKYEVDRSFINALKFGMPPSAGNALGVDRLLMLMTNTADIRDIILFPTQSL